MKRNIILSLIIALIMLMSSCEIGNTVGQKIDELNSFVTSAEISDLWHSYKNLDANKLDSMTTEQKDKIEIMYSIDLIVNEKIEAVKSSLYRPSSLEINEISVEIYTIYEFRTANGYYSESIYYIELYIDYSAQVQAGGFDRDKSTMCYVVSTPNTSYRESFYWDDYPDIYLTPYAPQRILTRYIQEYIDNSDGPVTTYSYSVN